MLLDDLNLSFHSTNIALTGEKNNFTKVHLSASLFMNLALEAGLLSLTEPKVMNIFYKTYKFVLKCMKDFFSNFVKFKLWGFLLPFKHISPSD